ncbi:MAG: thioesterase [Candidatus Marinimicrobia bacterium]|nr:thioesterase [Candidatus Neomarinimicrobiota bacterium]
MPRAKVHLPDSFLFSTNIPVRITDVNYGGHLANDAVLAMMHESRVRFLDEFGYSEKEIEGLGIIMSDAVIEYKSQGYQGDLIEIKVGVGEYSKYGCDIFYQLINTSTHRDVARAKTGIVFFDYTKEKMANLPDAFQKKMISAQSIS